MNKNKLIKMLIKNRYLTYIFAVFIGSFFGYYSGEIIYSLKIDIIQSNYLIKIIVAIALIALLGSIIIRYLNGNSLEKNEDEIIYRSILELEDEIYDVKKRIELLDPEHVNELTKTIKEEIQKEASVDFISEIRNEIRESEFKYDLVDRSEHTLNRIYKEIDALGRRGSINLTLGILTALTGVAALSYFVSSDTTHHLELSDFAIAFLPRLSIVLIIEVFSYFFLRLYKSSLSEIKYFQNEATNIEFNFVALEAAIHLNDTELIKKSVNRFIAIERNPVLKKGQTTRELESEEKSDRNMKFTIDQFAEILKVVKTSKDKD